jgi:hypothetical protein
MRIKSIVRFIVQLVFWAVWLLGMAMPFNAKHDMLLDIGVYAPGSVPNEPSGTALLSFLFFVAALFIQISLLLTHKTPLEKRVSTCFIVFTLVTFGIKYVLWWVGCLR